MIPDNHFSASMIDEHFFSNIGFVTDSLEATKTIVDSIEDDVRSVKTLIQERLQRRMDLEQLVSLLQTENEILKSKLSMMELENKDLQNSSFGDRLAIEEEYEDKILVAQAEMDRVLQENRAVKEERDSILSKAQELDLYCTQIENQLETLKKEHKSIIQQAQDAELEV
jgi:chromosome segregation ATPase